MSKRKVKNYTEEFKRSSAKLAVDLDQSISKTAIELGVCVTTLHGWIKKFYPNKIHSKHQQESSETITEELKQLRKENMRLRKEHEILKKAAAYFAGQAL